MVETMHDKAVKMLSSIGIGKTLTVSELRGRISMLAGTKCVINRYVQLMMAWDYIKIEGDNVTVQDNPNLKPD